MCAVSARELSVSDVSAQMCLRRPWLLFAPGVRGDCVRLVAMQKELLKTLDDLEVLESWPIRIRRGKN